MKAFEVEVNGKRQDYRVGHVLDLEKVRRFFEKNYAVGNLQLAGRHVIGSIEKNGVSYFLKLATSEGISHLTKKEFEWNEQFNKAVSRETSHYWAPRNVESGFYDGNLFYLVTDVFNGTLLAKLPEKNTDTNIRKHLPSIIEFTKLISEIPISITERTGDHRDFFITKTRSWYDAIPEEVRSIYGVANLLDDIVKNYQHLKISARHGDFAPWHLMTMEDGILGLIDGEHAAGNGVLYYDMAYFVQRVFCVLEDPETAKHIVGVLMNEFKYDVASFKTVLAARVIGGFLDESLNAEPNYQPHLLFKQLVTNL